MTAEEIFRQALDTCSVVREGIEVTVLMNRDINDRLLKEVSKGSVCKYTPTLAKLTRYRSYYIKII